MTVMQSPLVTCFGPYTTAAEVAQGVDLSGKTAIVTGGASNIGRETVRVLAATGADVIVPARDVNAARLALSTLSNVEVAPMDLLDPSSIDGFAANFIKSGRPLELLVLKRWSDGNAIVSRCAGARGAVRHHASRALPLYRGSMACAPRRRWCPSDQSLIAGASAWRAGLVRSHPATAEALWTQSVRDRCNIQ
jgi:hypothetical protein